MNKIDIKNIDETIYKEKLTNGIEVFLYPTKKTKNFYMTISVKYGGSIKEYTVNNKHKIVDPGTAHFLEHKIMNFTNRKGLTKKMNELGLYANAYTSYDITNYNMYGSKDPVQSLNLLLDLFYNVVINEKNVSSEKGIITEEFKMYNDTPNFRINRQVFKNVFRSSFLQDPLVGNLSNIQSISLNSLLEVYKDFYTTQNTFIIVTGNFEKEEVIGFLKLYMKNIKASPLKQIKIIKKNEADQIMIPFMEMEEAITIPKVIYSLKINKNKLKQKSLILRRYYLNFIFSSLFSNSSNMYETYKTKKLMINMGYNIINSESHYLMNLTINTEKPDEVIKKLKKDIKSFKIDEKTFNRKKKMFLNTLILTFENIEDVEESITNNIIRVGRIIDDAYLYLKDMTYSEMIKILKLIDFDNHSILKVIPKK